jgi:hypothetical protein
MTSKDIPFTSYGEWLLLNGSSSLDDLVQICTEFYSFAYTLAIALVKNREAARLHTLEALACALHNSPKYPGGAPRAWLARFTYDACCCRRTNSTAAMEVNYLTDAREAKIWKMIGGLYWEMRFQVVLYFAFSLSFDEIAQICHQPRWVVVDHLDTVKDLCLRQLQWAGAPASMVQVESLIQQTLNHQFSSDIPTDEINQIALDLAHIITCKKYYQRRNIYLQQALLAALVIAVMLILYGR